MEFSAWISIASICAMGAMSPGPSLAVVMKNTIAGGRVQGALTGVGHALGIGVYALIAVFGMAMLLQQFPDAMRGIEILGGLYLLWMGYQAFRHAGEGSMESDDSQRYRGFIDGLAMSGIESENSRVFLGVIGTLDSPRSQQSRTCWCGEYGTNDRRMLVCICCDDAGENWSGGLAIEAGALG